MPFTANSMRKITVCGNIGVGKSTLCTAIAKKIPNAVPVYESFEDNKYQPLFYDEYKKKGNGYNKFAFPMTMWFLNSRYQRELAMDDSNKCYIVDRGMIEDRTIFAQNYIDGGILSEDETKEYKKTFESYFKKVKSPDYYVYLRASTDTLMARINSRARGMETTIERSYIEDLQKLYEFNMMPKIEESEINHSIIETDFMDSHLVVSTTYENIMQIERTAI